MSNKPSSSKEPSSLSLDDFAPSYSKALDYPPLKPTEKPSGLPTLNRFTPLKPTKIPSEKAPEQKEYHIKEFCQKTS